MYIYRIMGASRADGRALRNSGTRLDAAPERLVVFSDTLVLDSHGWCAILQDRLAKQTKYLFMGKPGCRECGKCSKPPLLVDTIQVEDQITDVELKCRQIFVAQKAKEYCHAHGVTVTLTRFAPTDKSVVVGN